MVISNLLNVSSPKDTATVGTKSTLLTLDIVNILFQSFCSYLLLVIYKRGTRTSCIQLFLLNLAFSEVYANSNIYPWQCSSKNERPWAILLDKIVSYLISLNMANGSIKFLFSFLTFPPWRVYLVFYTPVSYKICIVLFIVLENILWPR